MSRPSAFTAASLMSQQRARALELMLQGRCGVPGCTSANPGGDPICVRCWGAVTADEAHASMMAVRSPFYPANDPELQMLENRLVLAHVAVEIGVRDAQKRARRLAA